MTPTLGRVAAFTTVFVAFPALAHDWSHCRGWERHGTNGQYCEVRTLSMEATSRLTVDATQNGGISVTAWDGPGIEIEARVNAWARNEAEARRVADAVRIDLGSTVRAEAPGEDHWSVSYRIRAPRHLDLDLMSHNGGLTVRGIRGELRLETHNGGLSLEAVAGDVVARTNNGGVDVELAGAAWEGGQLDVETRNGGVDLTIPGDYSAELEVGTVNGRLEIDFPVTVQGRVGREIRTTLGSGGQPIRVVTSNGSVRVRRR